MRIVAFIEDEKVIENILKPLGPWDLKVTPLPKVKAPFGTIAIDDSDSQAPFSAPPVYPDADYLMNYKRISMPLYLTSMVTVSAIYPVLLGMSRRALYDFHTLTLDVRFIANVQESSNSVTTDRHPPLDSRC